MEIAIICGGLLALGGFYELLRPKNRSNVEDFFIFYDSHGVRHVLHLNNNNILNSKEVIERNTSSYFSSTEMGICTISQEEILPGDEVIELKCKHFFKKKYGTKWLEQNNVCPLCREKFN